jgi:hypothetical protein
MIAAAGPENRVMKALVLLVLIALVPPAAAAEATASTTPYMALYQVLTPARVIKSYDRLVAIERIQSKLSGVNPSDIRVVIHAKAGAIPVPIAPDGRVDFPTNDALRDENPPVETNQPKGSLALTVIVALGGIDRLRVPWADVEAGLVQVKKFYADNVPNGTTAPSVHGIEVHFPPGSGATLTIEGRGERLLMADAAGRIVVTNDMAIEKEQPTLVFSRAPDFIMPYTDEMK